ncbi:MAG: hypothetical protein ACI9VR_003435 [Cognaticolwellia sp.]|jgi:hypothetical protein
METLTALRALDPTAWDTGLSPQGAQRAWKESIDALERGLTELPDIPATQNPGRLWIWCAANVFTAPLPWLVLASLAKLPVVLKAPSARPDSVSALAEVFGAQLVTSTAEGLKRIGSQDRVLGFGGDAAMAELGSALPKGLRQSLHGHRVSFAVIHEPTPEIARALALDAALYDGQGCMSPAAVFCLNRSEQLAQDIATELERLAAEMPRGPFPPHLGPLWRERVGLARILGPKSQRQSVDAGDWAVPLLPASRAQAVVLPRMLPVHPIGDVSELTPLAELPLSTLATDGPALDLPFTRVTKPGAMQRPALSTVHENVDLVRRLMV